MNPQQQNRPSGGNSRSVFVGNIPYEATEEQLQEIFSQVGPVMSFRLVFDRDTGKPKGYGFVEYRDSQTALSAMRNLNGYEIHARALRVYFAEIEGKNEQGGSAIAGANMQNDISKVLDGMSPSQLYEIMVQMKGLIQKNPEQAQLLLHNNPHLAYALLQAQVLLGIITPSDAQQLHLAATSQPAQPVHTNAPFMPMPMPMPGGPMMPGMMGKFPGPFPNMGPMPFPFMPPMGNMPNMPNMPNLNMPNMPNPNMQPPPHQGTPLPTGLGLPNVNLNPNMPNKSNPNLQPPPLNAMPPNQGTPLNPNLPTGVLPNVNPNGNPAPTLRDMLATVPEGQRELLERVLSLTQEQIDALPWSDRVQAVQLRQAFSQYTFRR